MLYNSLMEKKSKVNGNCMMVFQMKRKTRKNLDKVGKKYCENLGIEYNRSFICRFLVERFINEQIGSEKK